MPGRGRPKKPKREKVELPVYSERPDGYLTLRDAAKVYGRDRTAFQHAVAQGRLPAVLWKMGGQVVTLLAISDVEEYVNRPQARRWHPEVVGYGGSPVGDRVVLQRISPPAHAG